jgi:hypothetical protein
MGVNWDLHEKEISPALDKSLLLNLYFKAKLGTPNVGYTPCIVHAFPGQGRSIACQNS